jgi:hypothetical protein
MKVRYKITATIYQEREVPDNILQDNEEYRDMEETVCQEVWRTLDQARVGTVQKPTVWGFNEVKQ